MGLVLPDSSSCIDSLLDTSSARLLARAHRVVDRRDVCAIMGAFLDRL